MNVYLIQKEICFDYRKFPWIKKSRGSIFQKCDIQVVVSENEKEAKEKFLEKHKETSLSGFGNGQLTVHVILCAKNQITK